LASSVDDRRQLVEPEHSEISIFRQCELLGLPRSSFYYKPAGESEFNLFLMRIIDEQYTLTPFYGVPKMTGLLRIQGHPVGPKRVRRLMRLMGLEAIYPKPKLSKKGEVSSESPKYPYLLRGLTIDRVNQVWTTDITYIRLKQGFVYLVAVMDWFSRYVLSWEVSNSLDSFFCVCALDKALQRFVPEIFNNDQGSQFTSQEFTGRLETAEISISWDGCGRFWDNILIERLWRSVKWEEVYLKDYDDVPEAIGGLDDYFRFYNTERPHQSLGYQTPQQVFFKEQ
jgi:putative transposase